MKINFMRLLIFLPAFLFMAARIYIASVYVYEDVRKSERFFNVWSHYFSLIIDWMLWLWKRIYEIWKKKMLNWFYHRRCLACFLTPHSCCCCCCLNILKKQFFLITEARNQFCTQIYLKISLRLKTNSFAFT